MNPADVAPAALPLVSADVSLIALFMQPTGGVAAAEMDRPVAGGVVGLEFEGAIPRAPLESALRGLSPFDHS